MKFLRSPRSASEAHRAKLEEALETELAKLRGDLQNASDATLELLSVSRLITRHPIEAAIFTIVGGAILSEAILRPRAPSRRLAA